MLKIEDNDFYDTIVIGAGMSGLAAAIRLAMFNKKVLILESHSIPGGLNSYYSRGKRKFDVGLHALTNYVGPKTRGHPLNKLLKQLRIPYDSLKLTEQNHSKILFPDHQLKFNNNIELLISEISREFPDEIDHFAKLIEHIKQFDEVNLNNKTIMAKEVIGQFIKNKYLLEMILCPLLIYGSAWENDMDFSQFVIMFKSIYLEGFSRPENGVRTIIDILTTKFNELKSNSGSECLFRSKVTKIITENNKISAVEINNEKKIRCNQILSTIGLPETLSITANNQSQKPRIGPLSFCEAILITDKKPIDLGIDSTIIFYNNRPQYHYQKPKTLFDPDSAVVCFPNNFNYQHYNDDYDEGVLRLTHIANYELWSNLKNNSKEDYNLEKLSIENNAIAILKNCGLKSDFKINFRDIFTPTSIERYTHHFHGTVYGSIDKSRDGKTDIENLFVCGTDQGFLGIVGSMLSGISMANLHILSDTV